MRVGGHAGASATGRSTSTCSSGQLRSPSAAARRGRARSQPERAAAKVETMISSTRSSSHRLHHGAERVGMRDLAVHVDPLAAQLRRRARFRRRSASGCSPRRRVALRRHDEEARRALPRRARGSSSSSGSPSTVSFAITSTFASSVLRREVDDEVLDRQLAGGARGSGRRRCGAASPTSAAGCVETRISSTGGSSCASASRTRRGGIRLDDEPSAGNAGLAQEAERPSSRRRAAARRVS